MALFSLPAGSKPLKVALLFGPTGVGKTEIIKNLVLNPAYLLPLEIINADSLQVYRYLDIGTAKPAGELLKAVPHHLVDILNPEESFNVGDFIRLADQAVREISRRGKWPFITGGTAFYIKHFILGLPGAPPSEFQVRQRLIERVSSEGLETLYHELQQIDPVYAAKISASDKTRIIRALEVYEASGQPLSAFKLPEASRPGYDFLLLGLERPRAELNARIEQRVGEMFARGLEREVKSLLAQGYTWEAPAMQGIGYKEFCMMGPGCLTLNDIKTLIIKNTRAYAKRQMTFFKALPEINWFHPDEFDSLAVKIKAFWQS